MKTKYEIISIYSVADPGFPEGEGHQPLSLGRKPNIWQDFCRKLHENERNWIGAHVPDAIPGSTNVTDTRQVFIRLLFL